MRKKEKDAISHFRMDKDTAHKLDTRITRMGYTSRSEFFTAVAYAAIGEHNFSPQTEIHEKKQNEQTAGDAANTRHPAKNLQVWLKNHTPQLTEDEIREHLIKIIKENLMPVIAIRGTKIAFQATWKDIRTLMHDQTGIWTTESELREAYYAFSITNRQELTSYKNSQLSASEEEQP